MNMIAAMVINGNTFVYANEAYSNYAQNYTHSQKKIYILDDLVRIKIFISL